MFTVLHKVFCTFGVKKKKKKPKRNIDRDREKGGEDDREPTVPLISFSSWPVQTASGYPQCISC